MIQDIAPHQLHKEFKIKKPEKSAFIIYVWDNKILLKGTKEEPRTFLTVADLEAEVSEIYNKAMYLFAIDEQEFFLLQEVELLETEERHFYNPNFFRTFQPKEHAFAAITGIQLDRWYKNRKFCGRCGARNEPRTKERSLICPKCKNTEYPKLCPAVIIAVVHGNRILLSKYAGREYKNYALVAGFVEYGETLEDTVRREVMEEVGLKVGRMIILVKAAFRELRRAINPNRVKAIKLDGAVIEKDVVTTTSTYFIIYMLIIGISSLLLTIDNFDFTTTLTAVITCINNVGPGLAGVGPVENFADFSNFSKLVLSANMLIGRLEVFPIIILFMRSTWKKTS